MPAKRCQEESEVVFVNRRRGQDRRLEQDRCKDMPMDLFHRKRRKSTERRDSNRTLADDYAAFSEKHRTPDTPRKLSS